MDNQRFIDRYTDFWRHFHPGIRPPQNLRKTALHYYEILARKNVPYEKFNKICSYLEEEQGGDTKDGLSFNFNLVAYVLDWVRLEHQQEMELQESNNYISLPEKRTPLGQIDIEKLKPSLEILKRNCPNLDMLGMLERINTLRAQGHGKEDRYCQSCNNTGYIYVGERQVACCQCNKGTKIYDTQGDISKTRMATHQECQNAARGE